MQHEQQKIQAASLFGRENKTTTRFPTSVIHIYWLRSE